MRRIGMLLLATALGTFGACASSSMYRDIGAPGSLSGWQADEDMNQSLQVGRNPADLSWGFPLTPNYCSATPRNLEVCNTGYWVSSWSAPAQAHAPTVLSQVDSDRSLSQVRFGAVGRFGARPERLPASGRGHQISLGLPMN